LGGRWPGRATFRRLACSTWKNGERTLEETMKDVRTGAALAVMAFAVLLVAGAPLMAMFKDDPAATGKVTAYEAGKSISVQVGDDAKPFKIDGETKIEGEVAIGKEVQVWVKDGVATKIAVKKE
jgi:hypothetical protein